MAAVRGPITTFERRWNQLSGAELSKTAKAGGVASTVWERVPVAGTDEVENVTVAYASVAKALGMGAAGSAGAAVAVPAAVAQFATVASTGTAISTLSGAAATNATLAWLGGGSVAAGGGGMAVGAAVLTATVAAPVVLLGGGAVWWQARKATKARVSNATQLERKAAQAELAAKQLRRLTRMADYMDQLLTRLVPLMREANRDLGQILKRQTSYSKMNAADRAALARIATINLLGVAVVQTELATPKGSPRRNASVLQRELEAFLGAEGR